MQALTRELHGWMREGAFGVIIEQLNKAPPSASSKRIAKIIDLLKQARELNRGFQKHFQSREDLTEFFHDSALVSRDKSLPFYCTGIRVNQFPAIQANNDRLNTVLKDLYKALSRYHWRFVVRHSGVFGTGDVQIENEPTLSADIGRQSEFASVGWLLSRHDLVERIRRCIECSKWFYAVTDHQKYCSDNCRKRQASQSEAFRANRARYMRERYRPGLRERDELAKRQAKAKAKGQKH